jgi:acyl-coenzyme A thioesterase PaaI-like protein
MKKTNESWKTWWFRMMMNCYPMFLGTGGKIGLIAANWREVRVTLGLNLWTMNYVRTIFGGSMFSASDPFYMLMLMHNLGKNFVVWDKAAHIRFRRPAKDKITTQFILKEEVIEEIKQKVASKGETDFTFLVQWHNKEGKVVAEIERLVYIADKIFYEHKKNLKAQASIQSKYESTT